MNADATPDAGNDAGTMPGESGIPQSMRRRGRVRKRLGLGALLLAGGGVAAAVVMIPSGDGGSRGRETRPIGSATGDRPFDFTSFDPPIVEVPAAVEVEPEEEPVLYGLDEVWGPDEVYVPEPPPPPPPPVTRRGFVPATSLTSAQAPPGTAPETLAALVDGLEYGPDGTPSRGAQAASSAVGSAVRAERLSDPSRTVPSATVIPCVLRSLVVSTSPGTVLCMVDRDAYSADFSRRLLERGNLVEGRYAAALGVGESRVGIQWSRLRKGDGTWVALDSPAAGSLGTPGIAGRVETLFWERFGDAVLYTLIDDASDAVVGGTRGGSAPEIAIGGTVDTAADLIGSEIAATASIRKRITRQPGATINIIVSRDLDFSSVYPANAR